MRYLGVDVGTTAIKAAVFDADGTRCASASEPIATDSVRPGWSEQSMMTVWSIAQRVISQVAQQAGPQTVAAIGVAGQGDGLWALDANYEPVRAAILWNDQRAHGIVARWQCDGTAELIAQNCQTAVWPGTSAAAWAWLQENESESAERIAHLCHAKDWVGYGLTGEMATDYTDATIPFMDLARRDWSDDILRHCAAESLRATLPDIRPAAALRGGLSKAAAAALNLPAGLPVAVGTLDLAAMHVGAGLNDTGNGLIILGTTAVMSIVTEPVSNATTIVGATVMHPRANRWLTVQAPQSGASALDWLVSTQGGSFNDAEKAVTAAKQSPPGANGVLFQPYLTGERAPFVAPRATGALLGLTANTTPRDLARAVLEGVAFSLRHCAHSVGAIPTRFAITGGGARSNLWRQIIADTLNVELQVVGSDDLGLWGAALLGAGAAGLLDPYAASARPGAGDLHVPLPSAVRIYEERYKAYADSVERVRDTW